MKIELIVAIDKDKPLIQNLARFYVYDMSWHCGDLPGWEVPANGLYECADLSIYWVESSHHPFLIKVDHEIAGFALVNKTGSTPDVDWNMGEFFILGKFQGKGVGRRVAEHVFKKFPGVWEVMQMPKNLGAIEFWEKIIRNYTKGDFETTQKTIVIPKPHPMNVFKFVSPSSTL